MTDQWPQEGQVPPPLPGESEPTPAAVPPPLPGDDEAPAPAPLVPEQSTRRADHGILHTTEDTRTFPCPNCGGFLVFTPQERNPYGHLVCAACASSFPTHLPEDARVRRHDLESSMAQLNQLLASLGPQGGMVEATDKEVVCQACGSRFTFIGTLTATRCPACATPIQRDDIRDAPTRLRLDGVLPQRITEEDARRLIEEWINSRRLAPNAFRTYRRIGSFSSVYLPHFSYDAQTTTDYTGKRGEYYYVTVGSGNNRRTERRTRWYPAAGRVRNTFTDMTATAVDQGFDIRKIDELTPWPYEDGVSYDPQFTAGHLARTYDFDAGETFRNRVQSRIESQIEQTCRYDIGGDTQRVTSMSVRYDLLNYSQYLLPVWLLTVTFKGKPFQVFINGVTGEVQGQRPWSVAKITLLILLAAVIIAVIFILSQYAQQGG